MDGDARNGKVFFPDEDDEALDAAAPAFDPAAVLRAIEAEEEDDGDEAPRAFDPTSILRAIVAEDGDDETPEDPREPEDTDAERAVAAVFALSNAEPDDHPEDTRAAWDEADAADIDAADELPEDDAEFLEEDFVAQGHPNAAADLAFDADETAAEEPGAGVVAPHFARIDELDRPGRKPRIALMGEFSAGKSTLSNLLIGAQPLPMKVTATQLPPVWISWGDGAPYREDIHGETHPIDIDRLAEIDPADTRVIRIFEKSEVLEQCDIIDMPGISDPNMDAEVWERVIDHADGVIWCTHATQAWRQSEASVWDRLAPRLCATSILLVTRFDKILSETDRVRVMRRVARETEGLFAARLPISLTRALAAGDDTALLEECGAAAFVERFFDVVQDLARTLDTTSAAGRTRHTLADARPVAPSVPAARNAGAIVPGRILPRRVRPVSQPAPHAD